MSDELFRREVLQAKQDERLGKIGFRAPRVGWIFFAIGAASTIAILGLLIAGRYTRHERVHGTLVPDSGLIAVSVAGPGVVSRILAHEGDIVVAGQPLVEVSMPQDSVALGETQALVAEQLRVKQQGLQSDLELHRSLGDMQRHEIQERLRNLHSRAEEKARQAGLQKQRADSADELYQEWLRVESAEVISRYQMLQQRDSVLQHRANQIELEAQRRLLVQQADEATSALAQLEPTLRGQENRTRRDVADVEQSLAENAARAAVTLRARVSGTVTSVLIKPGQAVSAGQTALSLLPHDSELVAELWVPSSAIGFVDAGKPVALRYEAYPYQKFGQQRGRVLSVSRSAAPPDAQSRLLGTAVDAPRYRVEVALERQVMAVYGRNESLKPGMGLEADISVETRRLVEWVFDPLYRLAQDRPAVGSADTDRR
jgi:membrane fusion protein